MRAATLPLLFTLNTHLDLHAIDPEPKTRCRTATHQSFSPRFDAFFCSRINYGKSSVFLLLFQHFKKSKLNFFQMSSASSTNSEATVGTSSTGRRGSLSPCCDCTNNNNKPPVIWRPHADQLMVCGRRPNNDKTGEWCSRFWHCIHKIISDWKKANAMNDIRCSSYSLLKVNSTPL